MFSNYFKSAWRNLLKNKTFSFINLMGLAIGMACSLLIIFWVKDEYRVDAFHAHKNQLFRIYERSYFDGKKQAAIWTQGPLAEELKKKIPEIERATAYEWPSLQTFTAGDKVNKQTLNAAGPDFFNMFSFKMLRGTASTALKELHGLAISKKMAEIFFGSPEAAMGKTIRYDNRKDFTVSAVFENLPVNSTLQFDCLMTWNAYVEDNSDWAADWGSTDPLTFLQIRADANPAIVEAKIQHFLDPFLKATDKNRRTELALQPFHEYYLNSNIKDAHMEGGRIQYVELFSIVAVFILLIACINFMNLSTARSVKRSKEVGVRKVVGAMRFSLIKQFMIEAILLTVLSFLLSIVIIALLLPTFNSVTGKQLTIPFTEYSFWLTLAGLIAFTGLIAGSYPALFMSAMNPIRVLKSRFTFSSGSALFRKGLVVFQFALSIVLIVGMIVINRQVSYIRTTNLGYNRENLLYFPFEGDLPTKYNVLKEKLLRVSAVKQVSHITETPISLGWGHDGVSWEGKDPNSPIRFTPVGIGYDFIETMGLQLAAGREFSKEFATDTSALLVNEFAVKTMGFKDPIGKTVYLGKYKTTIVGVIKDFHFQSLHTPIRPMFAYLRNLHPQGSVIVRIEAGKTPQALTQLEKVYKEVNPSAPFSVSFADQQYEYMYKNEQVVSNLANNFAVIAIFISCLGLLGLSMFTAEQRRKEIGIRKILGADIRSLFTLLSKDFLLLVIIAFVIATPLAWLAAGNWLQNFAYRISVDWWMFAIAGSIAILIALITISFQTIKAAIANPVKNLRTE
jgi:putative ABC transport system permease protein